jgi:hypothetical protein
LCTARYFSTYIAAQNIPKLIALLRSHIKICGWSLEAKAKRIVEKLTTYHTPTSDFFLCCTFHCLFFFFFFFFFSISLYFSLSFAFFLSLFSYVRKPFLLLILAANAPITSNLLELRIYVHTYVLVNCWLWHLPINWFKMLHFFSSPHFVSQSSFFLSTSLRVHSVSYIFGWSVTSHRPSQVSEGLFFLLWLPKNVVLLFQLFIIGLRTFERDRSIEGFEKKFLVVCL